MTTGEVYIARLAHAGKRRVWVMFDRENTLTGMPADTKRDVVDKWIDVFGRPKQLNHFRGVFRPSELAMTIAELRRPTTGD